MRYRILLTPEAEASLDHMAARTRGAVLNSLERLAGSPSRHARPAPTPPYEPGSGMVMEEKLDHDGESLYVLIFFRYHHDETSLIVGEIVLFDFR